MTQEFPIPQFFTNKLFAELFELLGLAEADPTGKCDYLLTDKGVEFFYTNAAASPKDVMNALGVELQYWRDDGCPIEDKVLDK
jgi:hypothetical protein